MAGRRAAESGRSSAVRILVASPLHQIGQSVIEALMPDAVCTVAGTRSELLRAVKGRMRHDVALVDLLWIDGERASTFDGLDVLEIMHAERRDAPVIIAFQGQPFEQAHLAEAVNHPFVSGIYLKPDGPGALPDKILLAASGERLPETSSLVTRRDRDAPIHSYFETRRGQTASQLAAAIASGNVSDNQTLADVASVPLNTANKLVSYLEPLIRQRGEAPANGKVTSAVVHRWCGQYAQYLLSWGRRRSQTVT